jgi:signal transduction histidine kinase
VLETIREVLETLAGPVPQVKGLQTALDALGAGLQADEVALLTEGPDGVLQCRAAGGARRAREGMGPGATLGQGIQPSGPLLNAARAVFAEEAPDGQPRLTRNRDGTWYLGVAFLSPSGPTALLAGWTQANDPPNGAALLGDAAHSLRLALEREESERAHQEATALRRSQELQRQFLSRLSHELRTPLTAIRGYASSLMQADVTWDGDSQDRFLTRIGAESARLGRLVDDLLDFSAIEANILRIQPDWCDLALVLDAAKACLPPSSAPLVSVNCPVDIPVVWADHDRLEQVFVNLLDNALRHNPPGTRVNVTVTAGKGKEGGAASLRCVAIAVTDDGQGVPEEMVSAPFEAHGVRRRATSGAGLGLSIAQGIVNAHGGHIEVIRLARGTRFIIHLPTEMTTIGPLPDD